MQELFAGKILNDFNEVLNFLHQGSKIYYTTALI